MRNWYLLSNNSKKYQTLIEHLGRLDVEVFSPVHTEFKRRQDRPSLRRQEKLLFPGYVFLRFDPEIVHTTTIAGLPGAQYFVNFNSGPCVVSEELIAGLKRAVMVRVDQKLCCIECRNVSAAVMESLDMLVSITDVEERRELFYELLEQQMIPSQRPPPPLIYSALAV